MTPSFMTKSTRRMAAMSARGLPSTAMMSARLPGASVPASRVDAARLGAAPRAGEQRVPRRDAEAHECLELVRHEPVHAVRAHGEADAGAQNPREVRADDLACPVHLLEDRRPAAIPLLDSRRMEQDAEGADQPRVPVDHERDVVVGGQRAVLDGADPFLEREAEPEPAVGVRGHVRAGALGLLDRGANLLAAVARGLERGAGAGDAARREDLDVVGPVLEVLAHAAPDAVDAVEARQRPPVAVARGDATRGAEEPRARDRADLDRLPEVDVEEVLLGHDP